MPMMRMKEMVVFRNFVIEKFPKRGFKLTGSYNSDLKKRLRARKDKDRKRTQGVPRGSAQWVSCSSKYSFKSKKDALRVVSTRKQMGVYHCSCCGGWHLFHKRVDPEVLYGVHEA